MDEEQGSNELTETIKDWIQKFDVPMQKQGYGEKEQTMFKKGLIAGLQKGIELGQLSEKEGISLKLNF
jgi:hypothetical protein